MKLAYLASAAAVTIAVLTFALAGCSRLPLAQLDVDYQAGQKAGQSLRKHGGTPTDQSCREMYQTTAPPDETSNYANNKTWDSQREVAFVNGCMGRPTSAPPTSAGSPS